MFPRFVNLTDTQLSAGFFEGYIIHWEVQVGIGRWTRRWTNGLGTAHSNMGGPTLVNEKVVHILEKNIIMLNFEQQCDGH